MDRDQARENIRARLKEFAEWATLKSSRAGSNMYICPICGSGSGSHGTGAFSITGNKWKCFSCGKGGDIFDLIGELHHTADYNEQLQLAADFFNITIDSSKTGSAPRSVARQDFTPIRPLPGGADQEQGTETAAAFIAQSARNIERTDYHRGITLETLKRFNVGYCPEWRHPKTVAKMKAEGKPRLLHQGLLYRQEPKAI